MGCLFLVLALLLPRVALVIIFLFTEWFQAVFETWLVPLLGFILLPYTTLAYMAAILNAGGVTTGWLVVIIVAAIVDILHWGGGARTRRKDVVVVHE